MLKFPQIDPVIIKVGPLSIRWYGLMYLLGFVASYVLVRHQLKKKRIPLGAEDIDSLYFFLVCGLLAGARLGYVLFYNLGDYLRNPLEILEVWHGGMSFHGGLIGSIVAGVIFCRRRRMDFWLLSDLVIVTVPIGLGLGRLGNLINGELYGRTTNVPWGMVFPEGGPLPRHPSQLYELLLEGVALFSFLWFLKNRDLKPGVLTSLFLVMYGVFRIIVEFFRQPDAQIGFLAGGFTMGQALSGATVLCGVGILILRKGK